MAKRLDSWDGSGVQLGIKALRDQERLEKSSLKKCWIWDVHAPQCNKETCQTGRIIRMEFVFIFCPLSKTSCTNKTYLRGSFINDVKQCLVVLTYAPFKSILVPRVRYSCHKFHKILDISLPAILRKWRHLWMTFWFISKRFEVNNQWEKFPWKWFQFWVTRYFELFFSRP